MGNPRFTVPRHEKNLEFYIDRVLPTNLAHVYLQATTGQTVADFYRAVLIPMSVERVFGDELLERAYQDKDGVSTRDILLIACGYLTEAKAALTKGDRRTAWSAAMDAMSYCASAKNAGNYIQGLSGALAAEVEQAVSTSATRAAELRAAPYKEIGAEAVRIIRERGEGGETWKSATAAATEIRDQIRELAESKGTRFYADDGGVKTITGYLKSAPELEPYFLEKRGRPKKGCR